eukprot:1231786-Pleurochrysis_carterae.AAC.5
MRTLSHSCLPEDQDRARRRQAHDVRSSTAVIHCNGGRDPDNVAALDARTPGKPVARHLGGCAGCRSRLWAARGGSTTQLAILIS